MTDQTTQTLIIAFFASLAPTLAVLVTLVVSLSNGRKANSLQETTTQIHALTNSNLAKVTAALDVALEKITGLQNMIATLNAREQVAQALAVPPVLAHVIEVPSIEVEPGVKIVGTFEGVPKVP